MISFGRMSSRPAFMMSFFGPSRKPSGSPRIAGCNRIPRFLFEDRFRGLAPDHAKGLLGPRIRFSISLKTLCASGGTWPAARTISCATELTVAAKSTMT